MKPLIDKNDPRLDIFLFGARVGKTRSILQLAEAHNYVLLISADHAAVESYYSDNKYEGYIRVYECWNQNQVFNALTEALKTVNKLINNKGSKRWGVWLALDTVTHLQAWLKIDAVKNGDDKVALFYERLRKAFFSAPCNTISISAETLSGKPALWTPPGGINWTKAVDICARMEVTDKGERFFNLEAGFDRTGYLDKAEKPNILHVRNKLVDKIK